MLAHPAPASSGFLLYDEAKEFALGLFRHGVEVVSLFYHMAEHRCIDPLIGELIAGFSGRIAEKSTTYVEVSRDY